MIEDFVKLINDKNKDYVIFDVGSRDCLQSIEFYNTFPNAKIYSFECNPNTIPICKKNIEKYTDRITLIEGAVCDYNGEIKFYPIDQEKTVTTWKDGNPGASSLFISSGKYKVEKYVQYEITTNCHRLDTICEQYNIKNIDILWMDLQGAELMALRGLGNYLCDIKYIHTEACNEEIYTNQSLFPEINNFLTNMYGFHLVNNLNPQLAFQDVIYENKFNDPIFSGNKLTLEQQTFIRGKPKKYILHTIELLKKYTNAGFILEIGSIRSKMNHSINEFNNSCCNDGHSTYFWKNYTNANIYTVDINPSCKVIIESDNRLNGVLSFTDDAINFAKNIKNSIDLLFLDAWDVEPHIPFAEKHIEIYDILKDKLSPNCLILIDDTDIAEGGKGKLLIPQLIKDGFLKILSGRQTLFLRICDKESYDLNDYYFNKYSQRGHDGILRKITKELNIKKGYFIEFGAWDGIYLSNCRYLFEKGWNGCFIEADPNKYKTLVNNYKNTEVLCLNYLVCPTKNEGITLDEIYNRHLSDKEIDILSIDIDGIDYQIFENLTLKPKLIIIEGGFAFHPCIKQKIPYISQYNHLQQPLNVMIDLAYKKGYVPICFNQDTFLLRNDLYDISTYFKNIKNDTYSLWRSAYYNVFNQEDRNWLSNYRINNKLLHHFEHNYYLDLEHSLNNVFDIVIPVGPNDINIIHKQLNYTKRNIIGYRNIYLVSFDPSLQVDGCITIDEKIFPFSIETVQQFHNKNDRNGWHLQQLLKLYSGFVIPNIMEKYLVIDSDTFFLKNTVFVYNNKCLYNYGTEYHIPYFEHMKKLHNTLEKIDNKKSGICHHMMFENKYVRELIDMVENEHKDTFYNVFLRSIDDVLGSGASEYEIYFNYMLKNHSDKILIRPLKWENISRKIDIENFINDNYVYISTHWYS